MQGAWCESMRVSRLQLQSVHLSSLVMVTLSHPLSGLSQLLPALLKRMPVCFETWPTPKGNMTSASENDMTGVCVLQLLLSCS